MISKQSILLDQFVVSLLRRSKSKMSIDRDDKRIRGFKVVEISIMSALIDRYIQSSKTIRRIADYRGEYNNG